VKKIDTTRVPIYSWAVNLEDAAMQQAVDIANHMPVHDHLALMPDAHMGMGMPIGGVMPLIEGIAPNAVGVDIGCGMLAVRTSLTDMDIEDHKSIRNLLWKSIPTGFGKHQHPKEWEGFDRAPVSIQVIREEIGNARKSLGTLGGGNHFIEVQKGTDGFIWYMIHSGSRNFGFKICNYYNSIASEVGVSALKDLPYLIMGTAEAIEYDLAMNFALDFAFANRAEMSRQIKIAFTEILGEVDYPEEINIHHNYASLENYGGESVIVHRKGATLADKNTTGIIPGSQGTPSYIVRGKGSPDSFNSCSHGAGRVMSRTKATGLSRKGKRKFEAGITVEDAEKAMGGLLCRFTEANVDEAPQAYKDIREVMKAQEDLVDILVELAPYQISAMKG
jgi:tRNA-splicing ligase RtcB